MEGASAHHFSTHFKKALPPNSAQVMRIAQEMGALSTSLPLDLASSIFIRMVSRIFVIDVLLMFLLTQIKKIFLLVGGDWIFKTLSLMFST